MTADELDRSARTEGSPPDGLSDELRSLWLARAGRWHEAHDLCSGIPDPDGAWIHAHLHREEGDLANAGYWYNRARRKPPSSAVSLDSEWRTLATHFSAGP
ncbi:MAG: hypothetical protein GWO24_13230 [Akkermansiaceae bacterium]|nr:hypothetical protein [Akkermansiaceae bacterium]